ncbi:hypothetical protein N7457_005165 [Penicillium paradoxum]|uniref:uncharacterized protein n=1 Tax=Penicillium paradoxum TaxID=176176 RepID=UPI00254898E3|nr:uncharacterized protein N7457_005165 [Penicillium paradoxum]KAJ5780005.1 hypothetical protein N7457_005165 [Penicillium paradoxum]
MSITPDSRTPAPEDILIRTGECRNRRLHCRKDHPRGGCYDWSLDSSSQRGGGFEQSRSMGAFLASRSDEDR